MKKNTIKAIEEKLEAKKKEQRETIANYKAERARLTAKTESLEAKINNPESLDDYRDLKKELSETYEYIGFLDAKAKRVSNSNLTDAEYREIRDELNREIKERQENSAPAIQTALYNLIDLMDAYSADINELEQLLDSANRLHTANMVNPTYKGCEIRDINPDPCGWWQAFVHMYFLRHDTAQSIKNGNR